MRKSAKHPNPNSACRYLRIREGLSQAKLAARCGVTANDISRFERGQFSISIGTVMKLAAYLGVSVNELTRNDYAHILPRLSQQPVRDPKKLGKFSRLLQRRLQIGSAGERLVAQLEREKLRGTPYENGVNELFADDSEAGFDIMSFRQDGTPLYIEVKTTSGHKTEPFFLTADELRFLQQCLATGSAYELHRVYSLDRHGNGMRVIYSPEEVLGCIIEPSAYKVRGCV